MNVSESPHMHRKVNSKITRRIIEFHQKGFEMDFRQISDYSLFCEQQETVFSGSEVRVMLIDCCFNCLSRSYTYIHTVITENGDKGLLLGSRIAFMIKTNE